MKTLEYMTETELSEYCTACAKAIERVAVQMDIEKPLFVLVLFNDPKVGHYISNCCRSDRIAAMREMANRLEQRQDIPR